MYRKQFSLLRKKAGEGDGVSGGAAAQAEESATENLSSVAHKGTIAQQLTEAPVVEDDPLGLKVVYRPTGQRKVDIVFVHGLGGSSRMTWSTSRDLNMFWPLQFLSRETDISQARILTFGYNSNFKPGSSKTKVSILDFAKDLLYDLKYAQDESDKGLEDLRMGQKPIIFVAHSMGGILIKEAYMQGQNDPVYQDIVNSISSIIFLSTPHRGTHLAETLNRILQVSFLTSPMAFIAELAGGSQTLQKLNEQFRHVAPKLQIVSFYETRPTPLIKKTQIMVLEKDSSVLGYPGEVSKPLDADHHGVCKYYSTEDPRYITVRNVLKSLIGKTEPIVNYQEDGQRHSSDLELEEYLSITGSPEIDYSFFRDRWVPGTCTWILKHETFCGWLKDDMKSPRLLWIQGNAASGKSILSAFIIDHLIQLGLPCSYFFVRFNDLKKRNSGMILRSLACQLARLHPPYAAKLRKLEAATTDLKTANFRTIWQWLYKQTLLQLTAEQPLYAVIDGFDEAESPSEILRLFADLHLTSLPLRLLVVSRKSHEITSAWVKLGKHAHAEVIESEGSHNDFRSYISQELDVAGDDSYREEVSMELLKRASGNFLWVHLAVQKINSCHTTLEVEEALVNLPPGMEGLYDRMAASVQIRATSTGHGQGIGLKILGWAVCAQRLLSVEELNEALENDGLIEIHRTIGDLCGGFVVVDIEGKVSLIHQTAREYLTRARDDFEHSLIIDRRATHQLLFRRCIGLLMSQSLRSLVARNKVPALLDYATRFWFIHFSNCVSADSVALGLVVRFLKGPHVLTWISIAARARELGLLVVASRYLTDVVTKLRRAETGKPLAFHQALNTMEAWSTDFVKVVGKFGESLINDPDSILRLIPPFCPEQSMIFQQFGRKETKSICVGRSSEGGWDDCLTRFSMEDGGVASVVVTGGTRIAILATKRNTSFINIYNSVTFERLRQITHPERVTSIDINHQGSLVVSYGYLTTRVWDTATGSCIKSLKNPQRRPRPHSIRFVEDDQTVLVAGEDRCVRSFSLAQGDDTRWQNRAQIEEQSLGSNTVLNFPMCSALSHDGTMIAFGYRSYPLTVWELEPTMLVGQCNMELDTMTAQGNTSGEVFRVAWHPFSDEREVFGLTQVGLLFKWNPYDDSPSAAVQTGAHNLNVSADGSLVATGDAIGTVKVFASADLSLLYQLSSQDPITCISFSTDSRRLYDVRGSYGNVWQPNTLARLAEGSDLLDHTSDSMSEVDSMSKFSLQPEHQSVRVDNIITIAGQSAGRLYCYGTEDGVAILGEVGHGKACELERLTSFMSIEQIAWSEDGNHVAITDVSGKLLIKRVTRAGHDRNGFHVDRVFELQLPPEHGHITQLFFHTTRKEIFASAPHTLFLVDLESRKIRQMELRADIRARWACHPSLPDFLLGFGNTRLHIFSWPDLKELDSEARTYFPPRLGRASTLSHAGTLHGSGSSARQHHETLGRLLVSTAGSAHILLQLWTRNASDQSKAEYLLFDVSDICKDENVGAKTLDYTTLPPEIASSVREPLSFLSRSRLMFLNHDRWVCTWRLPSAVPHEYAMGTHVGKNSDKDIERYYFLPGDWVKGDEIHLCCIMADGTLLCPRNGDVASVQCARLRK